MKCAEICPDCAGEGKVRQEKALTRCTTCRGTGKVTFTRK